MVARDGGLATGDHLHYTVAGPTRVSTVRGDPAGRTTPPDCTVALHQRLTARHD